MIGKEHNHHQDFGECHCPCHLNPDIKHIRACCRPCPYCGKRLAYFYEEHIGEHEVKGDKKNPYYLLHGKVDKFEIVSQKFPWSNYDKHGRNKGKVLK